MLPASFQLPAAIILLAGGLLACFAGYRMFRLVLGIFGAILGALVATTFVGSEQTLWLIGAVLLGGLAGALIFIFAYFAGVALIGAGLGAMAAHVLWTSLGREPGMLVVIVLSIAGALLALWLERYVIVVATAFAGAQMAIVGGVALLTERTTSEAAARTVYQVYPLDPLPATQWDLYGWLALGLVGVVVQLALPGKRRK
ncbi:MAG: DUF4203 domain-containing protein [Acidobacteria bacterium]|nr:DUF4203 domain-containing protein [Acidobacteriota bacterium]MBA3888233.1 DUF4203 domain-containing protein [Acidobacteriota bacterium]